MTRKPVSSASWRRSSITSRGSSEVDTSTLAETAQVGDLVNVMRADVPESPIGAAAALRNAPASDGGYFVVGAIQGNELDA